MGALPHRGRMDAFWWLCIAGAVALAAPAGATPFFGAGTIDYRLELPAGVNPGVPSFDAVGAGQLTSAGAGYPILPHAAAGTVLVSSATDLTTFAPPSPNFVSVAPPALGAPAVSAVTAFNAGATAYTTVSLHPTAMGPDAAPGVATTVTNNSTTIVDNTSGVDNPGFAFTALAVRIGIVPAVVSYVQIGLTMDMVIDNPTLPDHVISTTPIVVGIDGTLGALPDFALADASLIVPLGFIGGIEFFDVFAVSIVPGLTVEHLGSMAAFLTFTGIVDPASFSLIEFPPSLLESMLPGGPALFSALASEVPEPGTLALLGAMLLLLAWRSRRTA